MTTNLNVGGIVREAVTTGTANLKVGLLVREALVLSGGTILEPVTATAVATNTVRLTNTITESASAISVNSAVATLSVILFAVGHLSDAVDGLVTRLTEIFASASAADQTDASTTDHLIISVDQTLEAFAQTVVLSEAVHLSVAHTIASFSATAILGVEASAVANQTLSPFSGSVVLASIVNTTVTQTLAPFAQTATLIVPVEHSFEGVEAVAQIGSETSALPSLFTGLQALANLGTGGITSDIETTLSGLESTADIGLVLTTFPDSRTFWIAGIREQIIAAGVVLLPTSETLSIVAGQYIIGSSQFYTVGEVYWDDTLRVHGTDWEFVHPFNHIIRILVDTSLIVDVEVIYYRWDIGVRAGFEVTSYPVRFAFNRTSIVAERRPPADAYFTVSYTESRPGTNPMTLFARYPVMVDEMLSDHTLYDGVTGFDTYRPGGYKIFDTTDNLVYTWDGEVWNSASMDALTRFYVKRNRAIYLYDGPSVILLLYTAGDPVDVSIPEALTYPLFGEGVGFNLMQDAFGVPDAATLHPAAYMIGQRAGKYDDWGDV